MAKKAKALDLDLNSIVECSSQAVIRQSPDSVSISNLGALMFRAGFLRKNRELMGPFVVVATINDRASGKKLLTFRFTNDEEPGAKVVINYQKSSPDAKTGKLVKQSEWTSVKGSLVANGFDLTKVAGHYEYITIEREGKTYFVLTERTGDIQPRTKKGEAPAAPAGKAQVEEVEFVNEEVEEDEDEEGEEHIA